MAINGFALIAVAMTGQQAYERDLIQYPTYHDGSPRPSWNQLNETAKQGWNQNPRIWREWKSP